VKLLTPIPIKMEAIPDIANSVAFSCVKKVRNINPTPVRIKTKTLGRKNTFLKCLNPFK
jgi:hypothetical protein